MAGASQPAWQPRTVQGQAVVTWLPPPPPRQATGAAVLAELQRQRQTLDRSRAAAQQMDASVAQSGGILKRMSRWWNL